jgi:tol-pal system protein YbgF
MKIPYFLVLTACAASNAYALSPPVLDDSTYNEPTPVSAPAPQAMPTYDSASNLDKLKADLADLKNRVQQQDDDIVHLKNANADLHKKLTDLHKSPAGGSKAPVLDMSTSPSAAGKTPAVTEADKDEYLRASELLKKGDNTQAQQAFMEIIKKYPASKYADNSQYWIGVALLNKGDKKGAVQAFDRVARTYPKSEKVPDALYKLGDTLLSLKNTAKAKEYFDYLIQNYPGTTGAGLAAKKKVSAKL